nr:MAG TPA: hypothetical protein [Caudoviricetes sp.]
MRVSYNIESFLNFLREAEELYKTSYDKVNELDKLTQDYLHDIELGDFDYKGRAKIATKLKETRQARRKYKDVTLNLQPVTEWIQIHKGTINELQQLLGKVRKEEKALTNRIYIRKVDTYVGEKSTKAET